MNTCVPLECVATVDDDPTSAPELQRLVFNPSSRARHMLEYCMGMQVGEFDENAPSNSIQIMPSMKQNFPIGWALVPQSDILESMLRFQQHNTSCPIADRRHFSELFSAPEYEYQLIPTELTTDLIATFPNGQVQRFSPPYFNLPRIRSSANPFYACLNAKGKLLISYSTLSKGPWRSVFESLEADWVAVPPPEFVLLTPLVGPEPDEHFLDCELRL